ncbi:hypothetical protein F8M41_023486 [Gigaspora margarita]|uniref:Uncharacterized protein n=1 Tax=Gigaspora margarita TaxID=4874 RepID=A0A8H4EH23_GIGMA|nr:hypothetical protein F8M41_023486 [Gigaspora margarita]
MFLDTSSNICCPSKCSQTNGFGHIHFHSENDAAIFYNYVKNRPFPYGPENIEIQFLPSKDENDEHVTYNLSNHKENFLQNNNDKNDIYELPDNSNKRNKRSKDEALSETNVYELPDNSKKSKRSEDKILNRTDNYELFKNSNKETREILNPQYALYENRFSQAKKNLEISGEFQPLRSERVLESTISTGPFVLNLCLEKEIDVAKSSIVIKNGVATLSISKKQPEQPVVILID